MKTIATLLVAASLLLGGCATLTQPIASAAAKPKATIALSTTVTPPASLPAQENMVLVRIANPNNVTFLCYVEDEKETTTVGPNETKEISVRYTGTLEKVSLQYATYDGGQSYRAFAYKSSVVGGVLDFKLPDLNNPLEIPKL